MDNAALHCPSCWRAVPEDATQCPHCGAATASAGGNRRVLRIALPEEPPEDTRAVTADADCGDPVCAYCRTLITRADERMDCPRCRTPHHADCWNENRGCTVFGCAMAPPDEDKIHIDASAYGAQVGAVPPPPPPGTGAGLPPAPGAKESVTYGIIGLFCFGFICGPVAIVKATKARQLIRDHPGHYSGDDTAMAGLVLGIIDLILVGFFMLVQLAAMTD